MEKTRYMNCMDFYMRVQSDSKQLQEKMLSQIISFTQNSPLNMRSVLPLLKSILEDRRKALDVMAETIVQFSVPASHRYLMYIAENDIDTIPLALTKVNDGPQAEAVNAVVEQLKADEFSLMKIKENKVFFKDAAFKLRKAFTKFFQYQRKVQEEITKVDAFMVENLMPSLSPNTFTNYMKWVRMVHSFCETTHV